MIGRLSGRPAGDRRKLRRYLLGPDGAFLVTRTAEQLASYGILRFEDVMAALPTGVAVNIDAKTVIEDATDPPHRAPPRSSPRPFASTRNGAGFSSRPSILAC